MPRVDLCIRLENKGEGGQATVGLCVRLILEEKGQGITEYGLIVAVVSLALVGGLYAMGGSLVELYEDIVSIFPIN
jgi:pilus assembly protein Flp/PilA